MKFGCRAHERVAHESCDACRDVYVDQSILMICVRWRSAPHRMAVDDLFVLTHTHIALRRFSEHIYIHIGYRRAGSREFYLS